MPSIRSNRVVMPEGVRPATLRFSKGVIVEISESSADLDYGDLVILPGLVDSHVHVNEPGRSEWEGFETATRAAAAGGATTIVDMPLNSIPPTTTVDALKVKRKAARGKLSVDVGFWGGLIPGSETELAGLGAAGVCGFKSFLVDSGVPEFPAMTHEEIRAALPALSELEVPLLLHAEDPDSLRVAAGDPREYATYLSSRPRASEEKAVVRAAEWADSGYQIHILHVSSAGAAETIGSHANLTGETCPHYLLFCSDEIGEGQTAFKCAPPIRDREQQEELWAGLVEDSITMIVSDHSPAPASLKAVDSGDFVAAWGGVGSLQLRLQASWTGAFQRGIDISRLATWLALEPARLAGLDRSKGSIDLGKDADFVVFDPDDAVMIQGDRLEHRHPVTPYDGMTLRGSVRTTILSGQTIFEPGRFAAPVGKMLTRND